jgi:hypothetical protein
MRPERRRRGKPAFAAADVENALALERDKVGDRGGLHAGLIASLHRLLLRLVRLQRGTSGAELLRLAPRVLELGARVGVNELTGLDSLEAVSF